MSRILTAIHTLYTVLIKTDVSVANNVDLNVPQLHLIPVENALISFF
ncbi:MAG: hypothetical protein WCP96_06795 [Methylococcaceae bacterium]